MTTLRNYRPLLIQNLDLRLGEVRVHLLRLNRHTPEAAWAEHSHQHGQLLIYLAGKGKQTVDGQIFAARAGTVIYIAPDKLHAFEREHVRPPLCLVLDVDLGASRAPARTSMQLSAVELAKVRTSLSRLFSVRGVEDREMRFLAGAVVLEIMHAALLAIGWLKPVSRPGDARQLAVTRMVERAVETHDSPDLSLAELARRIGYQQDYLNRLLKGECGLTLGQLRARIRVRRAQRLLKEGLPVHEVASRIGILDQNYFSRWFRQQTGTTPTKWRKNPVPLEPV